jgi:transposase
VAPKKDRQKLSELVRFLIEHLPNPSYPEIAQRIGIGHDVVRRWVEETQRLGKQPSENWLAIYVVIKQLWRNIFHVTKI